MDREVLASRLAEGWSYERIAAEEGVDPSTVASWARKQGLSSIHAEVHAARGGIERDVLVQLVREGLSQREMATRLGVSQATVKHWLARYDLRTEAAVRLGRVDRTVTARFVQRECSRHGLTDYIFEGRGYYRCQRCRWEAIAERRRRVKATLVAEAGGACLICGYSRYVGALQFHHRDPATKRFGLSDVGATLGIERLRAEARKCVLLCANCHAEVEHGLAAIP